MQKVRAAIEQLPGKKQYFELITAVLTIPVLLTVIVLNVHSLKAKEAEVKDAKAEHEKVNQIVVRVPTEKADKSPTPTQQNEACKREIGPIDITTPYENETVTDNPVSIVVSYDDDTYCAVVWSYKVNDGKWSEYDDKSIALYNLPAGTVRLELRVKSVVTREEKRLSRTFVYKPEETPSPTTGAQIPSPTLAN